MSEIHWATPYIGLPWVAGHSDCWSFARRVWRERFNWVVPVLSVDPEDARAGRRALSVDPAEVGWAHVVHPVEGDAVLMARGARPCHVGIWIAPESGPGVLHSVERTGVVFTGLDRLAGLGYRACGFYRWGGEA
jgi:cell wall-associated NlpC family hydrolase